MPEESAAFNIVAWGALGVSALSLYLSRKNSQAVENVRRGGVALDDFNRRFRFDIIACGKELRATRLEISGLSSCHGSIESELRRLNKVAAKTLVGLEELFLDSHDTKLPGSGNWLGVLPRLYDEYYGYVEYAIILSAHTDIPNDVLADALSKAARKLRAIEQRVNVQLDASMNALVSLSE